MSRMDCGSSALKISQREITLIPFSFSDLSGAKVRPALVISNDRYQTVYRDVVVLALTSNLAASDYKVLIENQDLENGRLPVKSAIRVDKPFSVLQSKVLKVQAKISIGKFEAVQVLIDQLIH
jgi:mRNA interferase MazF